jgi:hypothetical protein
LAIYSSFYFVHLSGASIETSGQAVASFDSKAEGKPLVEAIYSLRFDGESDSLSRVFRVLQFKTSSILSLGKIHSQMALIHPTGLCRFFC